MRPRLHLTAPTGWLNDPHGVTSRDGGYHLFHQYVPDSDTWAPGCHWAHATSPDLLEWTWHGTVLSPGDGDDGVWTGGLAQPGADPLDARIFYTSVTGPDLGLGRVRVATPDDEGWSSWTKHDVVVRPPEDLDLVAFRDPFVTREGETWRMFVGAAARDGHALALTWTSPDLETWTYDGVTLSRSTHEREPVWMGALWECPQVVEVDGHRAMVSSVWEDDVLHHTGYALGPHEAYADGRLAPTTWGQLSHGPCHYAPSFLRDQEGRPCLLFWMRGVADPRGTWTGCLSLPHLLRVRDGRLVTEPHPDLAARRGPEPGAGEAVPTLDLEWTPRHDGDVLVLRSTAGEAARLVVDGPSLRLEGPDPDPVVLPWPGGGVRAVLDGPALEVWSGDGVGGATLDPAAGWLRPDGGSCRAWRLR